MENPVNGEYEPLKTHFPKEGINSIEENDRGDSDLWKLYFDMAVYINYVGVGAVLISPIEHHYTSTTILYFL